MRLAAAKGIGGRHPGRCPLCERIPDQRHDRLQHGRGNHDAPSRPGPADQACQGSAGGHQACRHVTQSGADQRATTRWADQPQQSRYRLANQVVGRAPSQGPDVAESRNRYVNQTGVDGQTFGWIEVDTLHSAGFRILKQHVELRQHAANRGLAVLAAQVYGDALLTEVELSEGWARRTAPTPEWITALGDLELDDLGSQLLEEGTGVRAGEDRRDLKNPDPVEREPGC